MNSFSRICSVCGTVNHASQRRCTTCRQILSEANKRTLVNSTPSMISLTGKMLKQRYRVLFPVGKGGMGTVYIGKDMQLGSRLVAIKQMSQHNLLPGERLLAARNFQQEAHLLASLHHPNLPSIYDHFEEDQRWYLVMSFVKGQTLEEYLETKGGRLSVEEVLEIGSVLCNVLQYLHTQNPPIIFRDLKPSNIMRTIDGHLYLIDFGIARFFKPGQRKDTANQGSLGYASPEQYGRTQTTPSSDIYSLGVILYQILTGYDITANAFHFPPLQSLAPAVPQPLAVLITRMTDFDEKKRPHSVEVVRRELASIANGNTFPSHLPVSGKQTNSSLSLASRKPKNWLAASFLTGGIVLLLLVLYAFIWNGTPLSANTLHSKTLTTNTRHSTPFTMNTPSEVLNTFCKAMNSTAPDFQVAYTQLSRKYQSEHSFISFQEYFRGTIQCIVASSPDAKNQAGLHLTMSCQPDGPPPSGNPPPRGTPQGNPPPDNPPHGNPPPRGNPTNITLVNDGNNGWKIDAIYVVDYDCGSPHS